MDNGPSFSSNAYYIMVNLHETPVIFLSFNDT